MPTPMHVYADIAKRYGRIDPNDQSAVRNFFRQTLPRKSESIKEEIFKELLARDGEAVPTESTVLKVTHVAPFLRSQMTGRHVIAVENDLGVLKKNSKTSSVGSRRRLVGRSSIKGAFKKLKGSVIMKSADGTWYKITEYKGSTNSKTGLRPLTPEVDIGAVFKNATLFKSSSQ